MSDLETAPGARLSRARLLAAAGGAAVGGSLAAQLAGIRMPAAFATELAGATIGSLPCLAPAAETENPPAEADAQQ